MNYGGFWKRLGALLIDGAIFLPIYWLSSFLLKLSMTSTIIQTVLPLTSLIYRVVCHAKWGQTVGKKGLNLKVVEESGAKLSWRDSILRSFIGLILGALFVPFLVFGFSKSRIILFFGLFAFSQLWFLGEIIAVIFNKRKRSLHDMVAGTVVINIKSERSQSDNGLSADATFKVVVTFFVLFTFGAIGYVIKHFLPSGSLSSLKQTVRTFPPTPERSPSAALDCNYFSQFDWKIKDLRDEDLKQNLLFVQEGKVIEVASHDQSGYSVEDRGSLNAPLCAFDLNPKFSLSYKTVSFRPEPFNDNLCHFSMGVAFDFRTGHGFRFLSGRFIGNGLMRGYFCRTHVVSAKNKSEVSQQLKAPNTITLDEIHEAIGNNFQLTKVR